MSRLQNILLIALTVLSSNAFAAKPSIIHHYKGATSFPVAIVDLEEAMTDPMDNCEQRVASVKVREIAYQGASELIAGFRAILPKSDGVPTLFRIDGSDLAQGQMRDLARIVKPDASVLVLYQTCGSGHFSSVREIWLTSSINGP